MKVKSYVKLKLSVIYRYVHTWKNYLKSKETINYQIQDNGCLRGRGKQRTGKDMDAVLFLTLGSVG